jgi:hypothetical protein
VRADSTTIRGASLSISPARRTAAHGAAHGCGGYSSRRRSPSRSGEDPGAVGCTGRARQGRHSPLISSSHFAQSSTRAVARVAPTGNGHRLRRAAGSSLDG